MSVHVERLPLHPLLGRHVRHDSRSLAYAVGVLPKSAIVSQHWQRRVPIFDQGQLGSCTGNAAAGWVGTDDATRPGAALVARNGDIKVVDPIDENFAVELYSEATKLDSDPDWYNPATGKVDTGSDGISVAKVLQARGLAVGYTHAFSVDAVLSSLQSGPGLLGIPWYQSMFEPSANGHLTVSKASGLAGGHELVVARVDVTAGGLVDRIWFDNSWGASWGIDGSAWVTEVELAGLLANQGDFTVPAAVTAPGPTPVPDQVDASLYANLLPWAQARHTGSNKRAAQTFLDWAKAKGYTS